MRLRIKVFPITENVEEICCGGYYDVIKLDLKNGIATTFEEYISPEVGLAQIILGGRYTTDWYLFDNRDGRDEQTILQYSTDGINWLDWDWNIDKI